MVRDGACPRSTSHHAVGGIVPHVFVDEESSGTEIPLLAIEEHPDVDGRFSQFVEVVRSQIERDFQFCLHTINLLVQLSVAEGVVCVTENTLFQPTFDSPKRTAKLNINI